MLTAITGHKAQGLTVDHTLVVGDESIDGQRGYVALSRGRHNNQLYLVARHQHPGHAPEPDTEPISGLARRLERSRVTAPLSDHEVYDEVETALRWQHLTQQFVEAGRRRRSLTTELDRLTDRRRHLIRTADQLQERFEQTDRGLARLTRRSQRDDLRERLRHTRLEGNDIDQKVTTLARQPEGGAILRDPKRGELSRTLPSRSPRPVGAAKPSRVSG